MCALHFYCPNSSSERLQHLFFGSSKLLADVFFEMDLNYKADESNLFPEHRAEKETLHRCSRFPLSAPPGSGLDELMREELPLPPRQLLEVADPQLGDLRLLFWGGFSHHHRQATFGSHHDPTPPFGMVGYPLQMHTLPDEGFVYRTTAAANVRQAANCLPSHPKKISQSIHLPTRRRSGFSP